MFLFPVYVLMCDFGTLPYRSSFINVYHFVLLVINTQMYIVPDENCKIMNRLVSGRFGNFINCNGCNLVVLL